MAVRNRSGFSLIETLVALALFGMLATLALSVLVPMLQAGQRGTDLSDLRQEAATTLEEITADVEQSSASGIGVSLSSPTAQVPLALSVQQVLGLNQDGSTNWSPSVNVYWWDSSRQQIRVLDCPPIPSGVATAVSQSQPVHWTAADFTALVSATAPSRLLTGDVSSFSISGPSQQGLQGPVNLTLSLQRATVNVLQTFTLQQSANPAIVNPH